MSEDAQRPIGLARMEDDGTLVLDLRAEGPGGLRGLAQIRCPPDDARYKGWVEHLGGIRPGEEKLVPPWPETPAEGPKGS
jgi:hypothetical protein